MLTLIANSTIPDLPLHRSAKFNLEMSNKNVFHFFMKYRLRLMSIMKCKIDSMIIKHHFTNILHYILQQTPKATL